MLSKSGIMLAWLLYYATAYEWGVLYRFDADEKGVMLSLDRYNNAIDVVVYCEMQKTELFIYRNEAELLFTATWDNRTTFADPIHWWFKS
jgi:hypothetical protein